MHAATAALVSSCRRGPLARRRWAILLPVAALFVATPASAVVSERDALELERRLWAAPELAAARFGVRTQAGRLLVEGVAPDRATRSALESRAGAARDVVAPGAPLDLDVVLDSRPRPWAWREPVAAQPLSAVLAALERDAIGSQLRGLLAEAQLGDGVLRLAPSPAWPERPDVEKRFVRLLRAQPEVVAVRVPQLGAPSRRLAARNPFAPGGADRAPSDDSSADATSDGRGAAATAAAKSEAGAVDRETPVEARPTSDTAATPAAEPGAARATPDASEDAPAEELAAPDTDAARDADDAPPATDAAQVATEEETRPTGNDAPRASGDTAQRPTGDDAQRPGPDDAATPSELDRVLQGLLVSALTDAAGPGALLEVTVVDNVARIEGTVPDAAAARRVHEAAWRGDGIRRVEGRLRVGDAGTHDLGARPPATTETPGEPARSAPPATDQPPAP